MSEAKQFDISKKAVIAAFQAVKENAGSYGVDEQTITTCINYGTGWHQEVISRSL